MKKQLIIAVSMITGSILFSSNIAAKEPALSTDKQKFSYAIGLQIGQSVTQQNIDIDQDSLLMAIKDSLNGKEPQVPLEELQKVMLSEQQKRQQQQSVSADKNLQVGKAFLAENKKRNNIKTTASGLQYRVIKAGTGAKPSATDTVTVNYRGTLIDGTEFDSSYKRGEPATFPVNGVVKGWQEALPLMKKGAKWEIFVPSNLAYGSNGAGGLIGPNETLIFEIELLKID